MVQQYLSYSKFVYQARFSENCDGSDFIFIDFLGSLINFSSPQKSVYSMGIYKNVISFFILSDSYLISFSDIVP